MKLNLENVVTGRTDEHTVLLTPKIRIHKEVANAYEAMQKEAKYAGFGLEICSGFRSFEGQLGIWNGKAKGERALLDSTGLPISVSSLASKDLVYAILRWSALPGASRHHWGTDFDIFDRKQVTQGYQVQLIPVEYQQGGIFGALSEWLDKNMARFGFDRPYDMDRGGVSPERWHLSYLPLSSEYQKTLTEKLLYSVIDQSQIELKSEILKELPTIYSKYVVNVKK